MTLKLRKFYSIVFTLLIVIAAAVLARLLWLHYMHDPWTRDARVRAKVITIAPDVSGYVDELLVKDNQHVKKGQLLLKIDKSRYQIALEHAQNEVAARQEDVALRKDEAQRRHDVNNLVVSREARNQAESRARIAKAQYQQALNDLASAKLDLQRTNIYAPADGYITNLTLHVGDYIRSSNPAMALIDEHSFWVYGYFEETKLPLVKPGDPAEITLMSGTQFHGHVASIARGIYDSENPDSQDLIANVKPTFDWVRLARRFPVHIDIDEHPANQVLPMGATCTVVLKPAAGQRPWWKLF